MIITLQEDKTLLILMRGEPIAVVNNNPSSYKIEMAIGEHGSYEEVSVVDEDMYLDFMVQPSYEIKMRIKATEEPASEYIEKVTLISVSYY